MMVETHATWKKNPRGRIRIQLVLEPQSTHHDVWWVVAHGVHVERNVAPGWLKAVERWSGQLPRGRKWVYG